MASLKTAATLALNAIEEMEHQSRETFDDCACRRFEWQDVARVLREALGERESDPMGEALNMGSGVYRP